MKVHPMLELYGKIIIAENEGVLKDLEIELQNMVLSKLLTDDRDIMTLNLALKMKEYEFKIYELEKKELGTTVIVVGNPDEFMSEFGSDFDAEQEQLDSFQQEELEDFKDGNVVSFKNFLKKDD